MSRLAGVYLSELSFGKFGHLKDGSPSCLAQSNPQEFVIYNQLRTESITWLSVATLKTLEMWLPGVHETIISRNSTPLDLIGRLTAPSQIFNGKVTRLGRKKVIWEKIHEPSHNFSLMNVTFILLSSSLCLYVF